MTTVRKKEWLCVMVFLVMWPKNIFVIRQVKANGRYHTYYPTRKQAWQSWGQAWLRHPHRNKAPSIDEKIIKRKEHAQIFINTMFALSNSNQRGGTIAEQLLQLVKVDETNLLEQHCHKSKEAAAILCKWIFTLHWCSNTQSDFCR